jgi:molecular chaperone DnaK (HSP70)
MGVIGLDFGTGNSVLATYGGGQVQVFHPFSGSEGMPSDVLVSHDGIADVNLEHLLRPPPGSRRVTAIKRRLLGLSADDTERAQLMDLAVARLKYLYDAFAQATAEPVVKAVLTCPANTGQAYRDILLEIGRRVGLPAVSIVDEPTAAAVHHGLGEVPSQDERWLVVDWGCGTCDVSLIERKTGSPDLQVRCVRGDNALGGLDMDAQLRDYLADRFRFDPELVPLWEVEELKKQLSNRESASFAWTLADGRHLDVRLTRGELESLIGPLLAKARDLVREALRETSWGDVDYILCTGGPMLMPSVRRAIAEATDWDEQDVLWRDPLTSVAQGAARLAELKRIGGLVVTNQVAQPIGVRVVRAGNTDAYHCIISRGETRPRTGEVVLSTSVDLQDVIAIELREGDFDSAQSNTLLGRLNVVVRPENRGAVKLKLSVRLTDSSDMEVWVEPVGDPNAVRQLQPFGLSMRHDSGRVETKEARGSDPLDEFEAKTAGREVDPDTARQEYDRLKIKYDPDRDPARRDHWNARLLALDQAYNAYQDEVQRRIRASTQPDLPWDDAPALEQITIDEVRAQRLTHCLAMEIAGPATPEQLEAMLKRFPDYRRVLASYLFSLKRNPVLQRLLAGDDRPHVGLVVLLQNLAGKPIRDRHEVLKAAYRLSEDRVRQMLSDPELDVEALYDRIPKEAPPAVNPLTGAATGQGQTPRVKLTFDYSGGNTYVSGDTYPVHGRLKQLGCHWDGQGKRWIADGKHLTEKDVWPDA